MPSAFFVVETAAVAVPVVLFASERVARNGRWLYHTAQAAVLGFIIGRLNVAVTGFEVVAGESYVPYWTEIAVTGMFGMAHSVAGERRSQTLANVLATPASRLALFLGRALPSIVTGSVTAGIAFTIGALVLDVHFEASALWRIGVAVVVTAFACTSLGMCLGALGLRGRNVSLFADMIAGSMLLVSGANVPLDVLDPLLGERVHQPCSPNIGWWTCLIVLPPPRYMCTPHGRHGSKLLTVRMMSMPLKLSRPFSSKIWSPCTASS